MSQNKKLGIEIGEEEALSITADTLLKLLQKGINRMDLTTDNDIKIKVTLTPYKEILSGEE